MSIDYLNRKNIQWFPGHMMKTLRAIEADMKNVDIVLFLLDARIPFSSINPEIETLCKDKPRIFIMNKSDLADADITSKWTKYFKAQGYGCAAISSKSRDGITAVKNEIDIMLKELIEKRAQKGIQGAKTRAMVVGIPNVGKSTFINTFIGKSVVKAADKPGVTRGKQWVNAGKYDLLDMPGVLWKKFDSMETATNLAFIGSIKDDILDIEEIACNLLGEVKSRYPQNLIDRYKITEKDLNEDNYALLCAIGKKRGMLISGGEVNTERAAITVCDEFRANKLGRISLEAPPEVSEHNDI